MGHLFADEVDRRNEIDWCGVSVHGMTHVVCCPQVTCPIFADQAKLTAHLIWI